MIALSPTLYFDAKVSAFCSTFPTSLSNSSGVTGTGIFPAHKNPVTFGVFLTIYQLSFVTTILTRIYQGRILFFLFTFTPPARTETTSCIGTKTSRMKSSSQKLSLR
jgi:hypothetical protein